MARVQLALNVSDLEAAAAFYEKLFATPPAKRRPGYANFAIEAPPLKLVLIENPPAAGTLNHLGVEVPTADEVTDATDRLRGAGLEPTTEDNVTCCYAVQDKAWTKDPDGLAWEHYAVLADSVVGEGGACCSTLSDETAEAATAACC